MHQSSKHSLTLYLQHQYFYEKIFRSAHIEIAADTGKILRDLDLIARPFTGGLRLAANSFDALQLAKLMPPLRFYLRCDDPKYINYTDIPGEKLKDHVLYFSNLSDASGERAGGLKLHDQEYVSEEQIIPVFNSAITIPISVKEDQQLSLLDATGSKLSGESMTILGLDPVTIILNHQDEGTYQISVDGKDNNRFYYIDRPVWRKPLAIVELFPGKLLDDFQNSEQIDYRINFNNRETIWKYFLVSPEYHKFKKLSIVNKGREPVFNSPQKCVVHEEQEALMFESINKLPLSEVASHTFQLVDNYDPEARKGKVILKNLNKASPELLYNDEKNSREPVYSHIYI